MNSTASNQPATKPKRVIRRGQFVALLSNGKPLWHGSYSECKRKLGKSAGTIRKEGAQ